MKANQEILKEQLKKYEGQLSGLNTYIKELKDRAATYGTPREYIEEDLMEAENNIKYYEGQVVQIKEIIEKEPGGATYEVYKDAAGEWRWRLRAANHRIIADSGDGYNKRQDCLHAIALVKDSKDAPVEERE
jgi:uncharacterized protein YegP (UPF0339 family)